ncbi:MAG TPA: hypothetical protein VFI47_02290, partial [Acidimicrobiales bacterium]|nr:hypothetical protein [Acidimicrobiales bacterium]
ANAQAVRTFLEGIVPEGASDPAAAVRAAAAFARTDKRAPRVIYVGDGAATIGARSPTAIETAVRAGGVPVTVPLPLGAPRCDGEAGGPPRLVVSVDGEQVAVPIEERPAGVLGTRHHKECAIEAVRADVEVRFGDNWVRTGPREAEGDIVVAQRHPGATGRLDELAGNVIFTTATGAAGDDGDSGDDGDDGDDGPLIEVDDDRPSASARVAVSASRCDPHALIEYKRTFIFVAVVGSDGHDPVRLDVVAEGPALAVLGDLRLACLG